MPVIIRHAGPGHPSWGQAPPPDHPPADRADEGPAQRWAGPEAHLRAHQGLQESLQRRQTDLLAEVEALVGADPEAVLHDLQRAVLMRHQAALRIAQLKGEARLLEARFGRQGGSQANTHYEHERTQLLAELKEAARSRYRKDPDTKVNSKGDEVTIELTDGRAEYLAKSDPLYRSHLEKAAAERQEYNRLQEEISRAFAEKEQQDGLVAYLNQRLETLRALIYYAGRERKHG